MKAVDETTDVAPGIGEFWKLDLSSFASVKALAKGVAFSPVLRLIYSGEVLG